MADLSQERTEQATQRRKQDARRKGTVAKSSDLTSSFVMLSLALLLPLLGAALAAGLLQSMRTGLSAKETISASEVVSQFIKVVQPSLSGLVPVVCIGVVAGVAANFLQVGFHISAEPLNPQLNRLNPIEGFKKLISRRALFELVKTLTKLLLIGCIAWYNVLAQWDSLIGLSALAPMSAVAWIGLFMMNILLQVAIAWLVLGVLDYIFQKKQVDKQLMMTKDEVRREMRETESSPELRAEMQRRRRRLARQRMMAGVKHADVVITNPTEYAIALKYEPKRFAAPLVVAKGRHLVAERIRAEAKKNRVPIVLNPPLARSLFKEVEVGDTIPTALFQAVAEVLAYVFSQKGKRL